MAPTPAGPGVPSKFSFFDFLTPLRGQGVGLDALTHREFVVLSGLVVSWETVVVLAALLGVYFIYLMLMAVFLALCGVPRAEIARWALKQADRQRLTDLIRAARGLPKGGDPP